jgi:bifunctional DNA-binding transcriptional regulator/antitoxin component of YhaV-PrlF toxin-antitoxin module
MAMPKSRRNSQEIAPLTAAADDYDPFEQEATRGPMFTATVREDGSFVIPERVRQLMQILPGEDVQLEVTFAGMVMRPLHEGHDPEQWWFWSEPWQRGERNADRELREGAGRAMSFEEFVAELAGMDEDVHQD